MARGAVAWLWTGGGRAGNRRADTMPTSPGPDLQSHAGKRIRIVRSLREEPPPAIGSMRRLPADSGFIRTGRGHALRRFSYIAAFGNVVDRNERPMTMSDLATSLDAALWKIVGSCWKGKLLSARRGFSQRSVLLREALDLCERSGWRMSNAEFLGDLACGLA